MQGMDYQSVIKHFGGATAAARAINISRAAVHLWNGGRIPLDRQIQIEEVTNGALRADLSPELRKLLSRKVAA